MNSEEIKEVIKKRYAELAEESQQWYPYCFASQNAFGIIRETENMGYSKADLENIPEESIMGLGCGNPVSIADINAGDTVVDLGSGGGLDTFLAAQKTGIHGKVIGIDMTPAMIIKAATTARHYGYNNVEFKLNEIENLPFHNNSIDVVISNCTINLCIDKSKSLQEAFRILRPGGKLVAALTVTDQKIPDAIAENADAWTDCMGSACQQTAIKKTVKDAGFIQIQMLSEQKFATIDIGDGNSIEILSIILKARKPDNAE